MIGDIEGSKVLTDTSSRGDVLSLQEALQITDLEVRDRAPRQRPGGQHAARRTHGTTTSPQAPAAVVPFALITHALPLEHAKLHGAALARHLAFVA